MEKVGNVLIFTMKLRGKNLLVAISPDCMDVREIRETSIKNLHVYSPTEEEREEILERKIQVVQDRIEELKEEDRDQEENFNEKSIWALKKMLR